jgi:hypothetical protein
MAGALAARPHYQQPDIAVYSADGQLQMAVVLTKQTGATPKWASEFRRNLLENAVVANTRFFLIALPDHLFLWCRTASAADVELPDYDVDPARCLRPYVDDDLRLSGKLSRNGLHLAVAAWLDDLLWYGPGPNALPPEDRWLLDSGLYPAIWGGKTISS